MNAPREAFTAVAAMQDLDGDGGGRRIVLRPGQWWFGTRARSIRSLLGSCVAVSLWHPRLRFAGMCHYVLPSRDRRMHLALDGRYGDEAVELLVAAVKAARTRPDEYEARLWGGANMIGTSGTPVMNIGARNAARGRWLLKQHGFRLLQLDVAGAMNRSIELGLASGEVSVFYGSSEEQATTAPA
jgi:chemotaxis protein CheD